MKSVLFFLLFLIIKLNAQEIYQTKDGNVIVNSSYNNESFNGESKYLFALVNFETAEIRLSLDPTTSRAKSDSLNVCFQPIDAEKLNECPKIQTCRFQH